MTLKVTQDLTSKTTPVNDDKFPISDSADLADIGNSESGKLKRLSYGDLKTAISTDLSFGDVTGPGSSTDNAIARFDATTGKVIQNSGATIDDSGNLTANNVSGTNTGDQTSNTVLMDIVTGATEDTVQDMHDGFHSAGVITGGTVTDAGGGNITVSGGTGWIRISDDKTVQLLGFDWSALGSTAIPSDSKRWVGVEYNAGSPQVVLRTSNTFNNNDEFGLANLYYDGTDMHIQNLPRAVGDHASQMIQRLLEVNGPQRADGLIIAETGTRNMTVSAGNVWHCLTKFPVSAIDTSVSDTFAAYLGETQSSIGNTQWDNQNYNNAGVLTALTNNRWGNLWWYIDFDDGDLICQYGSVNETSQAAAEDEGAPSEIAKLLQDGRGVLLGRLTFQKGAATGSVESAFTTSFSGAAASDHNSLSNVQLAGSTVTNGHIDDQAQTIAGDKTFSGATNMTGGLTKSGVNVASISETATLTNKTLTSPVINVTSDATGDIYYRSAGGVFTRLSIGTPDQVLTVSSGLPSWQTPSGGGAAIEDAVAQIRSLI